MALYTGRSWIDRGNVLPRYPRHSQYRCPDPIAETEHTRDPLDDQMSGHAVLQPVNCQAGVRLGAHDTRISGNAAQHVRRALRQPGHDRRPQGQLHLQLAS